jgi:hypothetical protein
VPVSQRIADVDGGDGAVVEHLDAAPGDAGVVEPDPATPLLRALEGRGRQQGVALYRHEPLARNVSGSTFDLVAAMLPVAVTNRRIP